MQATGQLIDVENDSEIRHILHSFGKLEFFSELVLCDVGEVQG